MLLANDLPSLFEGLTLGEAMFLSRYTNTLDAKGRVSVPADFRAAVAQQGLGQDFDGIVVWPSLDGAWLVGCGMTLVHKHMAFLNTLKPHDPARIASERAIFGESARLPFDGTGRVSLPKDFIDFAALGTQIEFVGMGERFEVWDSVIYEAKAKLVRKTAKDTRQRLYATAQFNTGDGAQGGGA